MARKGINESQVFQIAEELRDTGVDPTLQNVREKLGTGSFATISSHLKKWRELKIKESPIPEQPQSFLSATKQIWATAWRESENTFEEQKKALFIEKEQWANEKEQMYARRTGHKQSVRVRWSKEVTTHVSPRVMHSIP